MIDIKRVNINIKNVLRKAIVIVAVGIFLSDIPCYGLAPASTSKNSIAIGKILAALQKTQIVNTAPEEKNAPYKVQTKTFEKFITSGSGIFNFERNLLAQHWHRLRYIIEEIIKGNTPEMVLDEVEIQPESSCNLNCKHCVGRDYKPKKRRFISKATIEGLIQSIINYNKKHPNLRISRIRISGLYGEPLINKKATLSGIKLALSAGIEVGLFTNGLLLDKEVREVIVDGLYVHVSLDASSEQSHKAIKGKEGFERIIQNIKELAHLRNNRSSKLQITVGYILHKENHNEIYNTVRRLKESGADIIRFKMNIAPTEDQLLTNKELDEAFKQIVGAKDDFEDDDFKIVAIHSLAEAASEVAMPSFRECYFAYFVGVAGDSSAVFACDHSVGVSEDDKKWFGSIEKDDYMNIVKIGSEKLASIEPIKDCKLCPPSGHKINSFAEFLRKTEEMYPGFLDYIEINYVAELKRDLALLHIKSGNYALAGNIYHEVAAIFDRHGAISKATKMEEASEMWKGVAKVLTRTKNYTNTAQIVRKKTILISGATGFIGRHLTEKLLADPDVAEIVILVSHEDDRTRALKEIGPRIKVEVCDIKNANRVSNIFKRVKPKIVYHLAGSLKGASDTTVDERERVYNINVGGTLNLAKAAQENGIELFVYTSSTRVYGRPIRKMSDVIDEDTTPNPVYAYGISKFIGEEIIRNIAKNSTMRYLTTRLPNVAGEFRGGRGQNEARDVMARFINDVFHNRPVVTYSDFSSNCYNFIDVDTVVGVLAQIINRIDMHNQSFNISPGISTSLEDLLKYVEEILGRKAIIKENDEPGGLSNVSSGAAFSNDKIRQYLETSVINIKEVVQKSVEEFMKFEELDIDDHGISTVAGFVGGRISQGKEATFLLDGAAKAFNKIQSAA